jgi:ribosomal subunit interface protein
MARMMVAGHTPRVQSRRRSLSRVNEWRFGRWIMNEQTTDASTIMKLPVQITFRDLVPLPSLEPEIQRRADKLDQWTPDVMSCHVVVQAAGNRHRTGHEYTVKVSVRVPDAEIAATTHHHDQDIHRAVHGAFDAVGRQLEDYARQRRGQVKQHEPAVQDVEPASSNDKEP